jgi:hypothetical protein
MLTKWLLLLEKNAGAGTIGSRFLRRHKAATGTIILMPDFGVSIEATCYGALDQKGIRIGTNVNIPQIVFLAVKVYG